MIENILQAVGNTPLMRLKSAENHYSLKSALYAKLEFLEPFSVKDRVAVALLNSANVHAGDRVIEPTSGNTGIGLAMACAALGVRLTVVMPENMTQERIKLMRHLGADVRLTPASLGMAGAVAEAYSLAEALDASVLGQFDNKANAQAHYETTGAEIYAELDGKVDIFVSAVGTGGTFSGTARYLKEKNPAVKAYAVEPSASAVLSGGQKGAHKIPGIGAGFVPDNFDRSLCDGIITVTDEDAMKYCKEIALISGVAPGISSGAALCGAVQLAKKTEGKNIVTVFPDTIERYLSVI